MITVAVAGRLGAQQLAACALGALVVNACGMATTIGMLSAMETLGGQAIGAGRYRDAGIAAQQALVISAMMGVVVALVFASGAVESVLLTSGQELELARDAQLFARLSIFGLPAIFGFEVLKRFLMSQGVAAPQMLCIAVCMLLPHAAVCWLLVSWLGFAGAPLANGLTYWAQLLGLLLYTVWRQPHNPESWPGWQLREAAKPEAMIKFLRLGLPGMLVLSLEWGSFEIMSLFAGQIGIVQLAAHAVFTQVVPLCFMVTLGFMGATAARVGNNLGAGRVQAAQEVSKLALLFVVCIAVLMAVILRVFTQQISGAFTDDEAVRGEVQATMPVIAVYIVFDAALGTI